MKKNLNTLEIVGLGSNGDGYAIQDDKKVFFPLTVPGDTVLTVSQDREQQLESILHKADQHRQIPPCKHFEKCGGCQLQHLSPALYKEFKKNQIIAALKAHKVKFEKFEEPVILGAGVRRRVMLKALRIQNRVLLGYYEKQTHRLLDIDECPICLPEIETCLAPLKDFLGQYLQPSLKAEVSITATSAGLDILIEHASSSALTLEIREFAVAFARDLSLACLSINDEVIVKFRAPYVKFAGATVDADSKSFLQASFQADQTMAALLHKNLENGIQKIADLFCGRGTLTFPLLQHAPVDAYEMDQTALNALDKAARSSHHQYPLKAFHRHLFREPLPADQLKTYDCVVLNPPRNGAHAQVIELAHSQGGQVIYVSCNPQTFARDAAILTENGYILDLVIPLDQFHWSIHVEIFAVFLRKQ